MSAVTQTVLRTSASARPMELSPHFMLLEFTRSETATRRGIDNTPDHDALTNLFAIAALMERVRSLLGNKVIHVSSGYRSPALNAAVGGSKTSDHMAGIACDFTCPRFGSPLDICRAIKASGIEFGQLIWEGNWVHISVGTKREVLVANFKGGKTTYTRGLP